MIYPDRVLSQYLSDSYYQCWILLTVSQGCVPPRNVPAKAWFLYAATGYCYEWYAEDSHSVQEWLE